MGETLPGGLILTNKGKAVGANQSPRTLADIKRYEKAQGVKVPDSAKERAPATPAPEAANTPAASGAVADNLTDTLSAMTVADLRKMAGKRNVDYSDLNKEPLVSALVADIMGTTPPTLAETRRVGDPSDDVKGSAPAASGDTPPPASGGTPPAGGEGQKTEGGASGENAGETPPAGE